MKHFSKLTNILPFLAFMLAGLLVQAQTQIQHQAPEPQLHVFQIYVGNLGPGESLSAYAPLQKLGFLSHFSVASQITQAGPSRNQAPKPVYLGPYLSQETADRLLERVKALGFTEAYVESDQTRSKPELPSGRSHTVQLGAFKDPDLRKFATWTSLPAFGMFIKYEDGWLKLFSGLYAEAELNHVRKVVLPFWRRKGFTPILRTVGD